MKFGRINKERLSLLFLYFFLSQSGGTRKIKKSVITEINVTSFVESVRNATREITPLSGVIIFSVRKSPYL